MNYEETLNYIHSLGNFGLPAGLERISLVLKKLGNPQNSFKAIHIAGTNGKGSVCTMLSGVFKAAGLKTGTFISPFIIDFRERIQINGVYISKIDLADFAQQVINTGVRLSEFEFITALAFLYFKEKKIDILICETGLGGRLDATNTLENLCCNVITKIGLDHTAILGNTLAEIAAEKCGILRDCPTVTSPYQSDEALNVIKQKANCLIIPNTELLNVIKSDISGSDFYYKDKFFQISLCGDYQLENAVTAIETVYNCGIDVPYETVFDGLKNAGFPARLEVFSKKPLVVVDGAHNPDGAEVLARELKKLDGKVTAVVGMMQDKNIDDVFRLTLPYCKHIVTVAVDNMPRSATADDLLQKAKAFCSAEMAENYRDAILKAAKQAGDDPIFVFGSLYFAAGMRPVLQEILKKI